MMPNYKKKLSCKLKLQYHQFGALVLKATFSSMNHDTSTVESYNFQPPHWTTQEKLNFGQQIVQVKEKINRWYSVNLPSL